MTRYPDDPKLLHSPDRADHIDGLEEHLNTAARLARALWEMASSPDLTVADQRTQEALAELAGMVSDHASAARFAFYKEAEARGGAGMTDPIFSAIAEWERLEALLIESADRTDAEPRDSDAFYAADEAKDLACKAVTDHEDTILDMRPQTVAGALALLRFVATIGRECAGNEEAKSDAIRACADLIEASS